MTELMKIARTSDVPLGERFDFWRHATSQAFACEVTGPREADGFRGQICGAGLGMLRINESDVVPGDAEPYTARRTSRLIAAAPTGCYKVGLQLSGTSVVSQADREAPLRAGDFTIYDADQPYTLSFDQPHRVLVLVFPHAVLGLPPERVARLSATRMTGREGMEALIAPFLVRIARVLNGIGPSGGVRLAGTVLDLLATVLAERLDAAPADPSSAHRAQLVQITAFIEQHLGDRGLSPDLIAAAHHISVRQLHKLFRSQGTTVSAWIRERRLERCRRDLRDPLHASRPVSAIAARWGYPDAAHFSRLFKAAFGTTPTGYRLTAAQANDTGGAPGPLEAVPS